MQFTKHIFITGFMGSGKSTISKRLSKQLKLDLIDLDKFIQESEEMTIDDIFKTNGEQYFRELESNYLNKIISIKKPHLIALGGGTVCFNDNLTPIKKNGILIYIELSAKTLFQRLENAKNERPLLKNLSGNDLMTFIEEKLEERKSFYQQAHISINGLKVSPQTIAYELIDFQKKDN
ncbi:MAG: shikimate kinase [Bacteroidota bacterium]|nr:shikimate kinase [Bacteroidota bacterium]